MLPLFFLYVMLQHYDAVKRFVSLGPMLVDVNMNTQRTTKTFMDSLLAFWPGLQVCSSWNKIVCTALRYSSTVNDESLT